MISNISKYKQAIGIVLTAILMIIIFFKISTDNTNYYQTLSKFQKLKEINNSITKNYYLVKFYKVNHYDFLNDDIKRLREESLKLKEITKDVQFKPYKYNIERYFGDLAIKEERLISFIGHFAVFKNYKDFFEKFLFDLAYELNDIDKKMALEVLIFENKIETSKNYLELFSSFMSKLTSNKSKYPEKLQGMITYFESYSLKYKKARLDVDNLETSFIKLDLNENISLLTSNFEDNYNLILEEKKKYNYLFGLFVLSLFVWIFYFIKNLNSANKRVKDTLSELNFQKSALDEHAIVSVTDAKGNITYVNEKFCEISGYEKDELLGQNHRILKSNEHDNEFFKELWRTISSGKTWSGEVKNRTKNGGFYWVSVTVVPFLNDNGKPFQYISIRTDITNRKKIENELLGAKEQADASNKIKGEFLANMSHELRTPLNGVIGMAHIALENEKDRKQKLYLEKINTSANILLKIINDLLDYSKIEAGKLPIENIEFRIDSLLQGVADLVSVKAYEKDLELHFNRDMSIPKTLYGDSLRISQVLVNIIGNSIKFTEKGQVSLEIGIEKRDAEKIYLKFDISDTGIGMSKKALNSIFQSFTQADASTTRKYGGTGLGLTITKNLVELMGGNISVSSEEGEGSCFTVRLPFEYKDDDIVADYTLTKDSMVYLYKLSDTLLASLSEILFSLKIQFKVVSEINFQFAEKDILITESSECLDFEKTINTIYLVNPNINLKDYKDFIKVITKPINPSVIYDSVLEFLNVDEKYLSYILIERDEKSYDEVRVLLVEDNEINQLVATTFLDNLGCITTVANNGQEAVEYLRDNPNGYDIVFMDVQMPIMNGYEATRYIRRELGLIVPIIAMTANAMKEDIDDALEVGMNKHISKPIDPNEIKKAISMFVQKKKKGK